MTAASDGRPEVLSFSSPGWEDYELRDSGNQVKLERYGPYSLIRPELQAIWSPALSPETWESAHAVFSPTDRVGKGRWEFRRPVESAWVMHYRDLRFQARITDSRHVGVFPEHATHWDWIGERVASARRSVQVLNLFGYTGLATLAAAQAGARVTHVDASRKAVTIARENQALSDLEGRPIRWIVDDVLKYVQREGRRGAKYDGIVMDPPRFGRGPKGEVWEFYRSFPVLCRACRSILSERPLFIVLTVYIKRVSAHDLYRAVERLMAGFGGSTGVGRLVTVERSAGRAISHALSVRWSGDP